MDTFTVIHDVDGKISAKRHSSVEYVTETSSPDPFRNATTTDYEVVSADGSVSIVPVDDETINLANLFWLISGQEVSMEVGERLATALHAAGYTLTRNGDQNDADTIKSEPPETITEEPFNAAPVYHQCTINNYYGPFEEGEN